MKRRVLLAVLWLLASAPAFAQSGDTSWVRRYDGPANSYDGAIAIAVDDSGNVYVTGQSEGIGTGYDYATIKYYPNGDTAWLRRYNGPANAGDEAVAIAVDSSGNVYVTGRSWGSDTSRYDYATVKYDASGNEIWVRRYDNPWPDLPVNGVDQARAITVDGLGNVYVTGFSDGDWTADDFATIKYDPSGNELWVQRHDGPGLGGNDGGTAIAVDGSGNVYVTGVGIDSIFGTNYQKYATIKYNAAGNELWVRRYDTTVNYYYHGASAIAIDDSGNVYVTGESYGSTDFDYATIKYDPLGNEIWVRRYDGPVHYYDYAYAIAIDGSNNVYVTGESWGIYEDYATIKYDPSGNELWVRRYNGPADRFDIAYAIAIDNSNNVYVTGASNGYTTVKYDSSGNQLWVTSYNGPANTDVPLDIALDGSGYVYVTGYSYGIGTYSDYATIKYVREWTILAYLNGDNDLEEFAIHDINAMEMVGSSAQVSVVAQIDRIPGYDTTDGDWSDTRRFYIVNDSNQSVINSIRLDTLSEPELGEQNMGACSTLVNFVNWGIENYPANHYAVVVWDHGTGWYKATFGSNDYEGDILFRGVSEDWTDNGTIGVSNGEWESAISEIADSLGRKIDLVGFDACLMQMWEVMDITDDYADYMVGSEEIMWPPTWDYSQFLSALTAHPTMSPEELGKEIVDAAVDGGSEPTQSCVDLAQVPYLTAAVDSFASQLLEAIEDPVYYEIVHDIRSELDTLNHEFAINEHIDLYDFADTVYADSGLPDNLRIAADSVRLGVAIAVTHNRTLYSWANGIAVYYPLDASDYDSSYNYLPVAFNTLWDEFIQSEAPYICGDIDGDGSSPNIADLTYLVDYLFRLGPPPPVMEAANVDGDNGVNIADLTYMVDYLFRGGPAPVCGPIE